jgi:hypothetical protein
MRRGEVWEATTVESHTFPHVPQLKGSLLVSTPGAPGHRHTPPPHVASAGQPVPQAPQLVGSVLVSTQVPEHATPGAAHRHTPAWHRPPSGAFISARAVGFVQ